MKLWFSAPLLIRSACRGVCFLISKLELDLVPQLLLLRWTFTSAAAREYTEIITCWAQTQRVGDSHAYLYIYYSTHVATLSPTASLRHADAKSTLSISRRRDRGCCSPRRLCYISLHSRLLTRLSFFFSSPRYCGGRESEWVREHTEFSNFAKSSCAARREDQSDGFSKLTAPGRFVTHFYEKLCLKKICTSLKIHCFKMNGNWKKLYCDVLILASAMWKFVIFLSISDLKAYFRGWVSKTFSFGPKIWLSFPTVSCYPLRHSIFVVKNWASIVFSL